MIDVLYLKVDKVKQLVLCVKIVMKNHTGPVASQVRKHKVTDFSLFFSKNMSQHMGFGYLEHMYKNIH